MSTPSVAARARPPGTPAAYAACRRMLRRHDPTYYLAVLRLPAGVRPAVYALYGFVRGADEIVDGAWRDADPATRLAALDAWEGELCRGLDAGASSHPVISAIVDAGDRFELPLEELQTYMDSMRVDCGRVRIETRSELERYMNGSAAAVGRIMAVILGARQESEAFGRLGIAFQLTNFVRDVRVDYGLDRVYLPAEELGRFGVAAADLGLASASPALRALLAAEVRRARELFAESEPAFAAAVPSARAAMRFARSAYLAVLGKIELADYDVLRRKIRPGPRGLARAALAALERGGA